MYSKIMVDSLGENQKFLTGKKEKRLHFVADKATREKIETESQENGLTITEYIVLAVLAFNVDVLEGKTLENFQDYLEIMSKNRSMYRINDEQGLFVALTDADREKMADILKTENFNLRLSEETLSEIKRRAKILSKFAGRSISASNYVVFAVKYFDINSLKEVEASEENEE